MKLNLIIFFGLFALSYSAYSQDELEKGRYITPDKLKYITIKDDFHFEYFAYLRYSPYTIKEKRKKENRQRMCGSIGYIFDGKGKGKYSIENGKIILKFEIDYSNIAVEKIDINKLNGISFIISELEKLEK
jgi:hypothetical protein